MSVGCGLVKLTKDDLKINKHNLSSYVFEKLPEEDKCTLEQAWDVLKMLTSEWFDLLGTDLIEDVDLGESCFLIGSNELHSLNNSLADISFSELEKKN